MVTELPASSLRRACDPQTVGYRTSKEIKPLQSIIGQERAVRSLEFGLGIQELGFNIYVAGLAGTGRTTAVKRFLEQLARQQSVPYDWCYVNDFREPYRPKSLSLPPGRAKQLQAAMKNLVGSAKRAVRRALESEQYIAKREETTKVLQQQRDEILSHLYKRAEKAGFLIQATPMGLLTIPAKEGKPLSDEEFQALSPRTKAVISQKQEELQAEIKVAIRQARDLERGTNEEVQELDREVALYALEPLIEELKEKYQGLPEVVAHLEEVRNDILETLSQFRSEPQAQTSPYFPGPGARELLFKRYEVNVLVDNSSLKGAPVIMELNPTYNNLFGRIEKEAQFGALVTDFTMIREGSLHRANGGYLVLPAEEVLRNLFSWDSLKRALRNREIIIEDAGERLGFITSKSLRPKPIPLDVKVILIGQPMLYHLLHALDEDFRELFKVKADFDIQMDRSKQNIKNYAAFVCSVCEDEKLTHLDGSALAKVVEHGSRLAEDQDKLSTRFGEMADIIREASYYASQEKANYTTGKHVVKAMEEQFYRSNLLQERIIEMIERGTLMINITGEEVGQVNGLSVLDLGNIAFGRPDRITSSVSLGREGLIDIEREAKLGGPIHTKGVLILAGYLAEKYAQDKPLSLSARLVFEQSYSGVEGDSASSAELYSLLSSLSGLPIKQGIAVTGSVNQKGEVQAIGGVNEKVEGFFEVCRVKSLTGEQGVIIPESNTHNLMLKEAVVEAVRQGRFHLWPVKTIDEGLEVLTGIPAGRRRKDGTFDKGTANYLVDKRLRELAERFRDFGEGEAKKGKKRQEE